MKRENKKTLYTLAAASFLHDMGSDMVFSLWPLFVTQVLGANMAILGFIDGLGDAIVSLSQAVGGYLSDRFRKRKIFVWTGYLFGGLSRIGYGLATSWPWLIPFRMMDRGGKIRGAPRDAIIADISTGRNRGKNFGLLRTMDNLGAVCGILLAIFLINTLGYRTLFTLAAIPSVIVALLLIIAIKDSHVTKRKLFRGIKLSDLNRNFAIFLFLSALFALGSFSYSFLLVFAKQFGFETGFVPILYLLFTIIASLTSLPFGRLADSISRKNVLFLSLLFWVAVSASFLFFKSYIGIVIAFVLYGLHKGAFDPVQKTLVSELAPKDFKASAMGGFQMVVGLCAFPASFIAGLLWDNISIAAPFYFSLGLTILALILLFFVKEKS